MSETFRLVHGDCLDVMRSMEPCSVDAVVTDPPYGLYAGNQYWDRNVPGAPVWRECLRLLKPGGHLLAFAGTRTQHRMAVNIEDAGLEIRDVIAWVYGTGFPKGQSTLKPAFEPITLARKPFKGTLAQNVQEQGTGCLNIEDCRVGTDTIRTLGQRRECASYRITASPPDWKGGTHQGRWPANLIHDGSDESASCFGGAARFFYCAKPSKSERGRGNDHPTVKPVKLMRYLCRLVTPPGGTVLDPFVGSGTTVLAARLESLHGVGIEKDERSYQIALDRLTA